MKFASAAMIGAPFYCGSRLILPNRVRRRKFAPSVVLESISIRLYSMRSSVHSHIRQQCVAFAIPLEVCSQLL